MKSLIASLLISVCIPKLSIGQTLSSLDTNKYSIHLPGYWKPGNKVWLILSDKLPLVCDELRDKELCGDNCNPKYSIEFEMSEPIIFRTYPSHIITANGKESWNIISEYGFSSALLLLNEKNELLIKFILVDTNEMWSVTKRIELQSFQPPQPIRISTFSPNNQYLARQITPGNTSNPLYQNPLNFFNNLKNYSYPTRNDMLGIIDEKIRSW